VSARTLFTASCRALTTFLAPPLSRLPTTSNLRLVVFSSNGLALFAPAWCRALEGGSPFLGFAMAVAAMGAESYRTSEAMQQGVREGSAPSGVKLPRAV
jgi:hypothetical protein